MSSRKRSYPEGEVDEHKESGGGAAADSGSGSAAAAASAAAPAAKRPRSAAVPVGAAAAPKSGSGSASGSAASVTLPPRLERMACSICMEALESDEKDGPESSSRVPRSLPCGHSFCSKCIHERLQRAEGGSLRCLAAGCLKESRVAAVTDLPKNFSLIGIIDQTTLFAAQTELGAPPCQQCDPSQPRRAATVFCDSCVSYLCAQHENELHAVPALASHTLVPLAEKAQQQQAATKAEVLLKQAAAPIKEQLKSIHKQLQKLNAKSQQMFPTLEHKHRQHQDGQSALVAKLRRFADQLENGFEQQQEVLESNRSELATHQLQIAPLQAEIDALLKGGDLDVATRGDALHEQGSELLEAAKEAIVQVEPAAIHAGCLLSFGLQLQLLAAESAILEPRHVADLSRFFKGINLENAQLLYRATRDGFEADDLWQRCAGKGPTLTLVQVAGNGFIFGAYTPVSWPADAAVRDSYVDDPSGRTFLFSLVNAHGRAVKLRLKAKHGSRALNLDGDSNGPGFGRGADLRLMWNEAADDPRGCYTEPGSFELDNEAESAAGLPPIPFAYDGTLLAGDNEEEEEVDDEEDNEAGFAAAEIEVYQL